MFRTLEIKLLDGSPAPIDLINKVTNAGPRSPAFFLDMEDWKQHKHIWEQYKAQTKHYPFFGETEQ